LPFSEVISAFASFTKMLDLFPQIVSSLFQYLFCSMSLSHYDNTILKDNPILYVSAFSNSSYANETTIPDLTDNGHHGVYYTNSSNRKIPYTLLPNDELATSFDGISDYLQVQNSESISITRTGVLTFEAWIRPGTLQFQKEEGTGYVWWAGKGAPRNQEYGFRMYSLTNTEVPVRPNRISAYAYNLTGGLGSGSSFEDTVKVGEWIHVAVVFNTVNRSRKYKRGYVTIFKNGVLRRTASLDQFDTVPQSGDAPLRIATRNFYSFFEGAIGKVAVYLHELTPSQIHSHFEAMKQRL